MGHAVGLAVMVANVLGTHANRNGAVLPEQRLHLAMAPVPGPIQRCATAHNGEPHGMPPHSAPCGRRLHLAMAHVPGVRQRCATAIVLRVDVAPAPRSAWASA